jgi:hypothetical protein
MVVADGLAIDGAVHEGEPAVLHVEERAWIERGRFALSGGRLGSAAGVAGVASAGRSRVPVVANRRLKRAASFSCARRSCSGASRPGPGWGRPASPGEGGTSGSGLSGVRPP